MANDVYVKFGTDPGHPVGGPLKTEIPDIEGDSTDAHHFWWCELRECGFDMDTPQQQDEEHDSDTNKPATGFKPVTLRKRVDWASTQLFLKCCEAAMATTKKSTEERGEGKINDVTVEVCRPAAGDKVPCVTVIYYGVRIIRYAISISEPEPAENITFEFDELEFQHWETDPATGEITGSTKTIRLQNHQPQPAGAGAQAGGGGGGGNSGSGSDDAGPSSGGAGGASPAPALAVAAAGGAPAAPGAAPDPTVNVNFPGLWQGTGFGILPD